MSDKVEVEWAEWENPFLLSLAESDEKEEKQGSRRALGEKKEGNVPYNSFYEIATGPSVFHTVLVYRCSIWVWIYHSC